ncbi:unnamed protein product [Durusdinium trenchii]|uniref:Uncharacterized protein n=1 Tax=Durusdinium trenchii TaxID=1381693 RepID=A0ABP0LRR0_9DINO
MCFANLKANICYAQSQIYAAMGGSKGLGSAIESLKEARKFMADAKNQDGELECLQIISELQLSSQKGDLAVATGQEALAVTQASGNKSKEAAALLRLVSASLSSQNEGEALKYAEMAEMKAKEADDIEKEAQATYNVAEILLRRFLSREAFALMCALLRSCYPDMVLSCKRVGMAVAEELDTGGGEGIAEQLDDCFSDVEQLLDDHQLGQEATQETETFQESEVAEVLAATWKEKRQEPNRLQKTRQFQKARDVKRSSRVEIEEMKRNSTCNRCGRKGHWAVNVHQFKFGNGEVETSTVSIQMPVVLAQRKGVIRAAVIKGDAPLLLSRSALKTLGATLDFKRDCLHVFGTRVQVTAETRESKDADDAPRKSVEQDLLTEKPALLVLCPPCTNEGKCWNEVLAAGSAGQRTDAEMLQALTKLHRNLATTVRCELPRCAWCVHVCRVWALWTSTPKGVGKGWANVFVASRARKNGLVTAGKFEKQDLSYADRRPGLIK